MERVFVDTSAWIAYVNDQEPHHLKVKELLGGWAGRLVTSNAVFSETVTLLNYSAGHSVAVVVGNVLLAPETATLVHVTVGDETSAWTLFQARRDKKYSFVDCTSFVLMRRLKIEKAVALDQDFAREGFELLS